MMMTHLMSGPALTAAPVAVVSAAVGLTGYTAASFGASAYAFRTSLSQRMLRNTPAPACSLGVTPFFMQAALRNSAGTPLAEDAGGMASVLHIA